MAEIESFIDGSQKIIHIFGCWPTFHDAEVIDFNLWRGDVNPDEERWVFPTITVKLHHWVWIHKADHPGQLTGTHHTLTTLRFHNLMEDLELKGFNHENSIFALAIERQERAEGPTPVYVVEFEEGFGMSAKFTCLRVEVVDAVPCTDEGVICS